VKEVDLSSLVSSGNVEPDMLYLQIIQQFTGYMCFVYVRGLEVIDDTLLKWLCEYTKAFPWRFIYLENTDSRFNFSENRDRCKNQQEIYEGRNRHHMEVSHLRLVRGVVLSRCGGGRSEWKLVGAA